MSYHIPGGGAPRWASPSEAPSIAAAEGDAFGPPSEEDWQMALVPQAFFDGERPFRVFLQTDQAVLAWRECEAGLRCLEERLSGLDDQGQLRLALRHLPPLLAADEDQHAQMLGHGKRWLAALLMLLRAHPPRPSDRQQVCLQLGRGLAGTGAEPARALGRALSFLRTQEPHGREAQAIRQLLHDHTLSAYVRPDPALSGNRELIDARLQDLLMGFGFSEPGPGHDTSMPPRRALRAADFNGAAKRLEEKQEAHLLLVAHDILDRVQAAFKAIWNRPAPSAQIFQPRQDTDVLKTLDIFGVSLGFNLRRLLERPTSLGGQTRCWNLHDHAALSERLGEQLPELRRHPGWTPVWPSAGVGGAAGRYLTSGPVPGGTPACTPPGALSHVVQGVAMVQLDPPSPASSSSDSDNEAYATTKDSPPQTLSVRPRTAP